MRTSTAKTRGARTVPSRTPPRRVKPDTWEAGQHARLLAALAVVGRLALLVVARVVVLARLVRDAVRLLDVVEDAVDRARTACARRALAAAAAILHAVAPLVQNDAADQTFEIVAYCGAQFPTPPAGGVAAALTFSFSLSSA